ncbi:multicopper oxidase family protein [Streptomyces pinistramenti]|uniref:multicopper oxidase family protein n=1 Tax=Streptomyces pinistramenti TaxID=2884812 RepID=UPI001D071AF0|nr:multicopper oxidase family protein [Streptomyces pinistramenti]MCB5907173.1 multicopper oxidase family protein [Streptomyces pinistramenti]
MRRIRTSSDPSASASPEAPARRAVLGAGIAVAGSGLLAACSTGSPGSTVGGKDASAPGDDAPDRYVSPDGPEVAAAEKRRGSGPVRNMQLTAIRTQLDLGGRTVDSWAYGDELPGREVRVTAGDTLAVDFANHLPEPTTVHWHGLMLRNDMDGAPGLTQRSVQPGASFTYRFAVTRPGTHWLHSHVGMQLDRGLYAPMIIEDPREPLSYDKEWVVVLDDWVDGVDGSTPDGVLAEMNKGRHRMSHGGTETQDDKRQEPAGPARMLWGARSRLLGGEAGDVDYPYHLINGRIEDDPQTFTARPGDRIRIRFINAGGDTAYRVALGDHSMTITHTDGNPVSHATTDALLIGMGERYDVLVTAKDGAFPLTALAEGKKRTALAILRTGGGAAPEAGTLPDELYGKLLIAPDLEAAESVRVDSRSVDRTLHFTLTGTMRRFNWAINGEMYSPSQRYGVREGERVRMVFRNRSPMWHPMHLHGNLFAMLNGGALKDTVIVRPGHRVSVDFDARNPGLWMMHCHNLYHSESGMMTVIGYLK